MVARRSFAKVQFYSGICIVLLMLAYATEAQNQKRKQNLRRLPPNNCGDGTCQGNESCTSCQVDCCPAVSPTSDPSLSPTQSPIFSAQSPVPTPTAVGVPSTCIDSGIACENDADCGMICNKGKDDGKSCTADNECSGNKAQCVVVDGSCRIMTASPTSSPTFSQAPTSSGGGGSTYYASSAAGISSAMNSAQPGDTIIMTDGTWTDEDIIFSGNGAQDRPITLRAETPGSVVLNGESRLRLSGTYLEVDGLKFDNGDLSSINGTPHIIEFRTSSSTLAHFSRITNTAIINYNPPNSGTDYRWVGIYGTNNRVDHCYFSGKNHKGALMIVWRPTPTEDLHRIDHNYFGEFASGGGENGWETIRIGTSTESLSDSSSVVEHNLFWKCDGEIEIISVKSGNNVLRGNTFDSCEGMLTLRHGRGNLVDGNFFFGRRLSNTGGVRIIDSDHIVINNYMEGLRGTSTRAGIVLANGKSNSALNEYFPVERAVVAFNTLYDVSEAIRIGWRSSQNSVEVKDSRIANNAVRSFSTTANEIMTEEASPTNMVYEGNYMYGGSDAAVPLGISPAPQGIYNTDPQLTLDVFSQVYRPDQSSPCIDAAEGSYPIVSSDMDGQPRPSADSNKDVGADEVGSVDPAPSGPLSSIDVGVVIGPSWM